MQPAMSEKQKSRLCLEKSSQIQNFFGKDFIGKQYSWKNVQLEISSHFWRTFPLGKISLEKISIGKIFSWKKFHWKKFPEISNPWT